MILTIQNNFGKLDNNVWVKDEDKLEIRVIHTFSPILELYAIVNNEVKKIVNNKFTIDEFSAEKYNISLKVILNGKVLKNVSCETLKIVKLDTEKIVVPEIEHLGNQINEMQSKFEQEIAELKAENEYLKAENQKLKDFIQNDIGEEEDE